MTTERARRLAQAGVVVLVPLVVMIRFALAWGQDINWDQHNYHLGIPALFANGAFWDSVAPVGIQNYLEPTLLRAQFWLIGHLPPAWTIALLAAVHSVAFMIAGAICLALARAAGPWRSAVPAALGFALCILAPASLSEVGTTYTDITTAIPVLAAYALLLERGRLLRPGVSDLAAGALLGAATALKLTNAVYVVGLLGFALPAPRQGAGLLLRAGAGAAIGFLAVGGPWYLEIWRTFGNPFFPYYNNIFHAPDLPPVPVMDRRFVATSVIDIWRYPYHWLFGGSPKPDSVSPSMELAFRDARWAIAVLASTAFVLRLMFQPGFRRAERLRPGTGLILAFAVSYLCWLGLFGIHRYFVAMDILCGAVILALVMTVPGYRWQCLLMAAALALTVRQMKLPDWGHLPIADHWQGIATQPVPLGGPAVVFLSDKPMFYIAASLPADTRYVGISGDFDLRAGNDTRFTRQLRAILAERPPPRLLVAELNTDTVPEPAASILASWGLEKAGPCLRMPLPGSPVFLCDLRRRP